MTKSKSLQIARKFLDKKVNLKIDRPLGSKHPKYNFVYEVNYGFVPNTRSADGEELDAYLLGIDKPVKEAEGRCIAIIHRIKDDDDKLIVISNNKADISDKEINQMIHFQEQWFDYEIIRNN